MSTRLLPVQQQTDVVTFKIEVNGSPVPFVLPVFAIEIMHEVNRIPVAHIYIPDGDPSSGEWQWSSEDYFVPGNAITILAGYQSEDEVVFTGIVMSQALRVRQNRMELQVTCKHEVVKMTTAKKSRHFPESSDSDAFAHILSEYEIGDDLVTTAVVHQDLVQYDTTDWDFVVMRAEANGLVCIADPTGVHTLVPANDAEPVATLQYGANVIEIDVEINTESQTETVTTQAWDPSAQSLALGEAVTPEWSIAGNLAPADLSGAIGGSPRVYRHSAAIQNDELQTWSDAQLLRSRMAMLCGRARVQGLHAIVPGSVIMLAGFGDRFNGPVWISAVRHEIGHGNWLSDIEFGLTEEWHVQRFDLQTSSIPHIATPVAGLHTAVVTALEGDPSGEARIRVRIPAIDSEGDGVWARVATLDAGSSRGTFFLPEIDDEVIIGFLNDDPHHPVVLGMVHSSAHLPPEDAADNNHIKAYYSRTGMRIRFDDENTVVTIDTPAGNIITLDDDAGTITLTDSNGNGVQMSSAGIEIESTSDLILKAGGAVRIEGGSNVEMKAGAEWKAEGSAGAEINSSAVTTVKGSLVQIN